MVLSSSGSAVHPQTVGNGPFYYMFGPGLAFIIRLYVLGVAYVCGSRVPRLHGQGKWAPATLLNLLFYG